jgi:hypothetical protein
MIVLRFCNVVAAESYDCSCKLFEIAQHKYTVFKGYMRTNKVKKELRAKMNHASSYAEWHAYAEQYDKFKGKRD